MGRIYIRFIDRQIRGDRILINNVKCYPSIYDVTDRFYDNGSERRKIWEAIAKNLESTANTCEKRWNELVEIYKSTPFSLPSALREIMKQFLNIHLKVSNRQCFLKATDAEEIINSGHVDGAYSARPEAYRFSVEEEISSELTDEVYASPTDDCTYVQSFFVI